MALVKTVSSARCNFEQERRVLNLFSEESGAGLKPQSVSRCLVRWPSRSFIPYGYIKPIDSNPQGVL